MGSGIRKILIPEFLESMFGPLFHHSVRSEISGKVFTISECQFL